MPPPPPPAWSAGQRLVAGIYHAEVLADLDFETYSEAGCVWGAEARKWRTLPNAQKKGLPTVGGAFYARHPTTEVLTLAYDLKDGRGRRRWHQGLPSPADLFAHIRLGLPLEAWNVAFEAEIWEHVCVARMGWPPVQPHQWRCAMGKARSYCLPGKLEETGRVLMLQVQKDADGGRLLDKFSSPRNPTRADHRTRILPVWTTEQAEALALQYATEEFPNYEAKQWGRAHVKWLKVLAEDHADTLRLLDYNETDIASEAEASGRIPDLLPTELAYWQDDQAINRRGVAIDIAAMESCIALIEQAHEQYNAELQRLTGIDAASKVAQIVGWLHGQGVHMDGLDEDAVDLALAKWEMPPVARRVLKIRAAVGSASVKKVFAMRNMLCPDGRLRGLYIWSGARTGRPTGSGPQPTNLPRSGPPVVECKHCGHSHRPDAVTCPWCAFPCPPGRKPDEWSPEAAEDALAVVHARSLAYAEHVMADAMATVAGVLRGLFIAKRGHRLVSSDFTAIEGVVVAALAGEQWRIDAYAQGAPMYLLSAERMFGVPVAEMVAYAKENGKHHPLRQKGKVGELGLGFGGWINALRQFGVDGTDEELKDTVLKWRDASPALVHFWGGQNLGPRGRWAPCMFGLEGVALQAVQRPGIEQPVMRLDGTHSGITYLCHGDVLYCRLPSGRSIAYHRPRIQQAAESWRGLQLSFEGWNSNPENGPTGWQCMNTYGGRLCENVVQATARDIQMNAIRLLEAAGYPIVLHTYDEVVAEVPNGFGSVQELEAIMAHVPAWAAGWPIKAAGGWEGPRYCKA